MTHEHLEIAVALEVPFFIVITKIDLKAPGPTLVSIEELLKQPCLRKIPFLIKNDDDVITAGANGLADNVVPIFCVSSVTGRGLDLLQKFLHVLPPNISVKEKERLEEFPSEFQIDETFMVSDVGQVVGGLLTRGLVHEGSQVKIGPLNDGSFKNVSVQSIHRNKVPCKIVHAGQSAALSLSAQIPGLRRGMVLLPRDREDHSCLFFQVY